MYAKECSNGKHQVSNLLALHPSFHVVSEGDHAHSLPDSKSNSWGNTTVQALDTVLSVDVGKGVGDRGLRRSLRVCSTFGQ